MDNKDIVVSEQEKIVDALKRVEIVSQLHKMGFNIRLADDTKNINNINFIIIKGE